MKQSSDKRFRSIIAKVLNIPNPNPNSRIFAMAGRPYENTH